MQKVLKARKDFRSNTAITVLCHAFKSSTKQDLFVHARLTLIYNR